MNYLQADKKHIWHPFTQHQTERDPIVITSAKDTTLYDENGKAYLDMISSWWTCLHGHAHPKISDALAQQAQTLDHVMFAGFTHPPAVELAQKLANVLPGDLSRVFFSDNGSTSVEVALKLAYQYWKNQGDQARKHFIAFDGAYHGDTFGAMAVGRGSGFFKLFEDLLCEVKCAPFPATWEGDAEVTEKETAALAAFDDLLDRFGDQTAAVIVEPLLQGASGMRMCRPEFLKQIVTRAQAAGVLVIFDEVATGFGRTGTMFACERIGVVPDLICLSKGLTGGYLPMSVTVCRDKVFEVFLDRGFEKAFAHGHSFTANPLGCAVALASLQLFEDENTLEKIAVIETQHRTQLAALSAYKPRVLGSVLAFDIADDGYKNKTGEALRDFYLGRGLNIRPLGSTIYLLPPYCITETELETAYTGLQDSLSLLADKAA